MGLSGRGTTWLHEVPGPPGAPTVVLLHGWMATGGLNWFAAFEPLGEHFRVLALDHRGHGRGIRTGGPFRLADCADDAVALLDELGIDDAVMVGYSMGGPIAQLAWQRHPDRVRGLVLCATAARFQDTPLERATFAGLAGLAGAARITPRALRRQLGERIMGNRHKGGDELSLWARAEVAHHDPSMVVQAGRAIGRFSSRRWLHEVDVPTAVLLTRRDQLVPPARQSAMARMIRGATVHDVEGDHMVVGLDTDEFIPVLVDACTEVAERAAATDPG